MASCETHSNQVTGQSHVRNSNLQYDGFAFDTNSMIGQIHTLLDWEIFVQIPVADLCTQVAEK